MTLIYLWITNNFISTPTSVWHVPEILKNSPNFFDEIIKKKYIF